MSAGASTRQAKLDPAISNIVRTSQWLLVKDYLAYTSSGSQVFSDHTETAIGKHGQHIPRKSVS
jgi:hypothetical protein